MYTDTTASEGNEMTDTYAEFQQNEIRKAAILAIGHYPHINSVTVMRAGYPNDPELALARQDAAFRMYLMLRGL